MEQIKILIIDNLVENRAMLTRAIKLSDIHTSTRVASSSSFALERMSQIFYDIVIMDINILEPEDLEVIKAIQEKYPNTKCIVILAKAHDLNDKFVKEINIGAIDFISKPSDMECEKTVKYLSYQLKILFNQVLIKKIRNNNDLKTNEIKSKNRSVSKKVLFEKKSNINLKNVDLILIAASTGGPPVLKYICTNIPSDFDKPILIVQHMPANFTKVFAESLNKECKLNIVESSEGEKITNNKIIIAAGGYHPILRDKITMGLDDSPLVHNIKPAADVLFKSVAKFYRGASILVFILTGMGNDGTEGVNELKKNCNCYCITQDEKSCTVYGMPRSVDEYGLSDEVLHIDEIVVKIKNLFNK